MAQASARQTAARSALKAGRASDVEALVPRWRAIAPQLLLILLTISTYWPVCTFEFLFWDDHVNVSMNPDFSPPTFHSIVTYWSGPHEYMYIPLTYTVWGMWSAISPAKPDTDGIRLNPYMFHTLNLGCTSSPPSSPTHFCDG